MRRQHDVVEPAERMIGRQRFLVVDVEARAGDAPAAKRGQQRLLVDDRPARGVDQERRRLHRGELAVADEPARPRAQHEVNRHDIRRRKSVSLSTSSTPSGPVISGREVLAPRHDVHAERLADAGDLGAQPSEPDDAERLAVQSDADGRLPRAAAHGRRLLRDLPRERQDQTPRELDRRRRQRARARHRHALAAAASTSMAALRRPVVTSSFSEGRREQGARKRRALAHGDDDVEGPQAFRDGVCRAERLMKRLDGHTGAQARPISHRQGDVLVVVENRDARSRRRRGHVRPPPRVRASRASRSSRRRSPRP